MDYTLRIVTLGAVILGMVSGILGSFAVLRRQSLMGDMVSHAALPGIVLAFMLTGLKASLVLMAGAAVTGLLASLAVTKIISTSRIKSDSAFGLSLSVFFGFGLMLLTIIQRSPYANKAGLDKFLFGQAAALLEKDVRTAGLLGAVVVLLVIVFWKEFKLISFDPEFARSTGLPVKRLDALLNFLIVASIILGLQMVGVILMSALLIAPAAAARQWTNRMGVMVALSAFFGGISGGAGAAASSLASNYPTGPLIILACGVLVVFSMLFAPRRGLLWKGISKYISSSHIRKEMILQRMLTISSKHSDPFHPHEASVIRIGMGSPGVMRKQFREMEKEGLIVDKGNGNWTLTLKGLTEAKKIRPEEVAP